jgi:hypothetical protein
MRRDKTRLLAWVDSIAAKARTKPRPVYVGQTFYALPGAVPVTIGSPQESSITLLRVSRTRPGLFVLPPSESERSSALRGRTDFLQDQRDRLRPALVALAPLRCLAASWQVALVTSCSRAT